MISAALPLLLDVIKDPAAKAAHQNAAKAAVVIQQWRRVAPIGAES